MIKREEVWGELSAGGGMHHLAFQGTRWGGEGQRVKGVKMKGKENPSSFLARDGMYRPWKVIWQRYLEFPENTRAPQISQPLFVRWGHVGSSEKWSEWTCVCYLWAETHQGQHWTLWLPLSLLCNVEAVCAVEECWRNRLEPELYPKGESAWRDAVPAADFA